MTPKSLPWILRSCNHFFCTFLPLLVSFKLKPRSSVSSLLQYLNSLGVASVLLESIVSWNLIVIPHRMRSVPEFCVLRTILFVRLNEWQTTNKQTELGCQNLVAIGNQN